MKTKIDEAREIIDVVDKEMMKLFIKRMSACRMVAEYKIETGKPVFDSDREASMKEKNIELLSSKTLEKYYLTFLEGCLKASRDYQEDLVLKSKENK